MSGGHFDYNQYRIEQIADEVQHMIDLNDSTETDQWGDSLGYHYPAEVIAEFQKAVHVLRLARIYAQRIDWLVSGDDGPDNFMLRLAQEIAELEKVK
jgi:hypothetical protein